ncbi:GNAT family N-acetyltransferase [Acidithiobacillus ferrianus]|uniref:GNAT family N-acetyltransferase n=1 Tax=Acidithiobacillus ferrianus TaxID=2678518 RepID=UPI0034E51AB6
MIAERGPLLPEMVIRLLAKDELAMILPLVQELNPGVPSDVLAQRLQDMTAQGYQCAAAFVDDCCIGVAGIWLGVRFWCGRYLDVDNVIVDSRYRGAGIGQQLMDWVERYAHQEGCEIMVLDAYVINHPAHRFYQRNSYQIVGYHFVKSLRSTR